MTKACSCGIDVHAHIVPESFPRYLGSRVPALWPSTQVAPDAHGLCHRHVMIAGKNYRTVSEKCWSATRRLADLPDMGLDCQVISPMPELLSYWMEAVDAQPLLRYMNEQIASMCAESDGMLKGFCAVPLQDIALAISELHHAIQVLGLAGVEIGSNVNGVVIGDPVFEPFFSACESMGVPVFVHALKPTGMDRLLGPANLQQVLAYPTDVGLAAASAVTGNLMQRHPGLRIAFSHGGGTFSNLLPRLQQSWHVFPALREQMPVEPTMQARQLFYDTLVFDAATLRHLVDMFGASQLMIGTDYPFNFHDATPVRRLQEAGLAPADIPSLLRDNAQRFLNLRSVPL
jgi:aminocarboxymuconate-semialdehyde decarboxylase